MDTKDLVGQILETWSISNRINLYLLDAIAPEHLGDLSVSKGRTVGEQFAHMHGARMMWLKASEPSLLEGLTKLGKDGLDKALLAKELDKSAVAVARLLERGLEAGKVKSFKPHPVAFLGYLIAHEGHHRGQIILSLKQTGHSVDRKVAYGIWEWGTR